MRLLLDSHALIWSQEDTGQLSPAALAALSDPANDRLISAASIWEIAIKVGKKRLPLKAGMMQELLTGRIRLV